MECKTGLTLIVTLLTLSAFSHAGTVSINGALQVPGCDMVVTQQTLEAACYRQGQWVHQSQPLARLAHANLAEQNVQTELKWLDKQQQRGVIIISYQ